MRRKISRPIHFLPIILLVVALMVGNSALVFSEEPLVRSNIAIQGDGTAIWNVTYVPGSPDYAQNKEAYDSLGDSAYKDAWVTTLNSTCGWLIQRSSIQVSFPTPDSLRVTFRVVNFSSRSDGSRRTVDLTCLRDAGFRFQGASEDGKTYEFSAIQFCDLMVCSGPYALKIVLSNTLSNPSFDEENFQLHFQAAIIPGFPMESILARLAVGVALLAIMARRRRTPTTT